MAIADTSRSQLRFIKETTAGTTPATPNMRDWRFTGESLNENRETISSQEIRSDRQTTDLISVAATVSGDVNVEASFEEHDDFIAAALQGTESTPLSFSGSLDSDGTDTFSGTGLPTVEAGQWIRVSGFSNAANNGVFRVASATSSAITVDRKLGTDTLTLASEVGATAALAGSFVKNGTTKHSFTIEKEFSDISQFFVFRGAEISAWSGTVSVGEIMTYVFSVLGRSSDQGSSSVASANTASFTNQVQNAVDNVGDVAFDGTIYTDGIQSISFALDNSMREQRQIGTFDLVGIGSGTLNLTGTMTAYFSSNNALYNKFINNEYSSFDFYTQDIDGNVTVYSMPRIKFSTAQVVAGAINQDVMLELEYQAIRDPNLGWTMGVSFIPA